MLSPAHCDFLGGVGKRAGIVFSFSVLSIIIAVHVDWPGESILASAIRRASPPEPPPPEPPSPPQDLRIVPRHVTAHFGRKTRVNYGLGITPVELLLDKADDLSEDSDIPLRQKSLETDCRLR